MRQIANWAKVGIEFKLLSQRDVDTGESATDRRSDRALQTLLCAFKGSDQILGNILTGLLICLCSYSECFPFKLHAGRFQNADNRVGDFGPDAVAENKRYFVTHDFRFLL